MKTWQIVLGLLLLALIVLFSSIVNVPIDDEINQDSDATELNFSQEPILSKSSQIQSAFFGRESSSRYVGRSVRELSSRNLDARTPTCRIPNGSSYSCDCDTDDDCPSGYYCEQLSGADRCTLNSNPYCQPHEYFECNSGDVYWYNSCGILESKKEECNNLSCEHGQSTQGNCSGEFHTECYNGNVYWFDACGNINTLKQECGSLGCSESTCNTYNGTCHMDNPGDADYCRWNCECSEGEGSCNSESECENGLDCIDNYCQRSCSSESYYACYNDDLYWYNSCGDREGKRLECGSYGCNNNECNSPPTCEEGWQCRITSGYAFYEYFESNCSISSTFSCQSSTTCRSDFDGLCEEPVECIPRDYSTCFHDDVYWFDSCGNSGDKRDECGSAGCSGDTCNEEYYCDIPDGSSEENECDCDDDFDCPSGYYCDLGNGPDACVEEDNGCHEGQPGDSSYCSSECPCAEGEGDCDEGYDECEAGLTCMSNVGEEYGYSSGTDVCEAEDGGGEECFSHDTYECRYDDVWWVDSCGNWDEVKLECGSAGCENGRCVDSGGTCEPNDYYMCSEGNLYSFDSCGRREEMEENCGGNGCTDGACNDGGEDFEVDPDNRFMRWTCKNSSTMDFEFPDGSWLGKNVECKNDCSDDTCTGIFKNSTFNQLQNSNRNSKFIQIPFLVAVLAELFAVSYSELTLTLLVVGTVVTLPALNLYFWPNYDRYTSYNNLLSDYLEHGINFFPNEYAFRDKCLETLNNQDNLRYEADEDLLAAWDTSTAMLAIGRRDGAIVHCQIINWKGMKQKIRSKGWEPIINDLPFPLVK